MIKLIKQENNNVLYWSVWRVGDTIVLHSGIVGERGEDYEINLVPGQSAQSVMQRLVNQKLAEQFQKLDNDLLTSITIEYKIDGWGSDSDLEKCHQIEDLMDDALGWTGNGYSDGNDYGSGDMHIYCMVLSVENALPVIIRTLEEYHYLEGATIFRDDEDESVILYPATG